MKDLAMWIYAILTGALMALLLTGCTTERRIEEWMKLKNEQSQTEPLR